MSIFPNKESFELRLMLGEQASEECQEMEQQHSSSITAPVPYYAPGIPVSQIRCETQG